MEWAKIEPSEGVFDEAAIGWYEQLLGHCEALGLKPMVTLHHFTLPAWVAEKGGFAEPETVAAFGRYVAKVIERLGSRVPLWCTFNEPMVLALGSYLAGFMPPALKEPAKVSRANFHMFQAHAAAYAAIHAIQKRSGPWSKEPVQVGIAHNMLDFIPDRWWHPLERILAMVIRRYYNGAWLGAITGKDQSFGVPGLIPAAPFRTGSRKPTADFIGVNYYTKAYVRWRPRDASEGSLEGFPVGVAFARRNEEKTDLGWAIHPAGFRNVLRQALGYGLPVYVTENGIADRVDSRRERYLSLHLREIARLVGEGREIRGYYHWSLMDNFEWREGFSPRFGLFHVDYETFHRTPRDSALRFRDLVRAHAGGPPRPDLLGLK